MTDHRKILATFTLNDTLQFRLTDAGLAHLSASACLAKVENDGTCKMQAWEFASVFGPTMRMGASSMVEACRVEVLEDHYACAIRQAGHAPTPAAPALAHINRVRASRYEQPLDPAEAGWTGEDVEREAVRLGWTGSRGDLPPPIRREAMVSVAPEIKFIKNFDSHIREITGSRAPKRT